jgi:hypothetical protein
MYIIISIEIDHAGSLNDPLVCSQPFWTHNIFCKNENRLLLPYTANAEIESNFAAIIPDIMISSISQCKG